MYLVSAIHSRRGYTPRGQNREFKSTCIRLHLRLSLKREEAGGARRKSVKEAEEKEEGKKMRMKLTRRNFLPDAGRLIHTRAPVDIPHRLETGFWEGDEISSYYDPMVCPFLLPSLSPLSILFRIDRFIEAQDEEEADDRSLN